MAVARNILNSANLNLGTKTGEPQPHGHTALPEARDSEGGTAPISLRILGIKKWHLSVQGEFECQCEQQ